MTAHPLEGIERAVFGPVGVEQVDTWLDGHVRARLSSSVELSSSVLAGSPRSTACS